MIRFGLPVVLALALTPALAGPAGAAPPVEDSMAQRMLACTGCHGKQGLIVLDQIRTLDRARLVKRLGALRPTTLRLALQTLQSMFAP